MRGVIVAAALCALVSGAEAKTWTCEQLGYSLCDGGKCVMDRAQVRFDLRENTMRRDMDLSDGDAVRFTPLNKNLAVYAIANADQSFSYGHCWAVKPRR